MAEGSEDAQKKCSPILARLKRAYILGEKEEYSKLRALAREILNDWDAVVAFVKNPDLPPTNNEAERALRHLPNYWTHSNQRLWDAYSGVAPIFPFQRAPYPTTRSQPSLPDRYHYQVDPFLWLRTRKYRWLQQLCAKLQTSLIFSISSIVSIYRSPVYEDQY